MAEDKTFEKVLEKINEADNILVALSRDPSVDEMAAAIGLTISLDRMGKHATAIYSGKTPNALQFLEPEKTFEPDTNSLQDFIIALDKEKADHLRYKVEGDYVKVYITPYRTTISEKDLEFTHGDFSVDLVISLDVSSADQLDEALLEYGRILHDAGIINVTNSAPGRMGEIEWSRPEASSVSEMVLDLLEAMKVENVGKDVATALLTGIVAATERFSNGRTTQGTMALAAKLMGEGADQQLIVEHMNEGEKQPVKEEPKLQEKIDVEGEDKVEEKTVEPDVKEEVAEEKEPETKEPEPEIKEPEIKEPEINESGTNDFLEPVPVDPIRQNGEVLNVQQPTGAQVEVPTVEVPLAAVYNGDGAEKVRMEDGTMVPVPEEKPVDYSAMIDAELNEPMANPAIQAAPTVATTPEVNGVPQMNYGAVPAEGAGEPSLNDMVNQMVQQAQQAGPMNMEQGVTAEPTVVTGTTASMEPVLPMPDGVTLPPPPTPPVDFSTMPPVQAMQPEGMQMGEAIQPVADPSAAQMPEVQSETAPMMGAQQVVNEPVSPAVVQPVSDPGAFKIPGT